MIYHPQYINNTKAFIERNRDLLLSFQGKSLSGSWVVWDTADDSWLADGPILLDFEGELLEFCCDSLEYVSVTRNTVSLDSPPQLEWSEEFCLCWQQNVHTIINDAIGQSLKAVKVIEYRLDTPQTSSWILNGIQFVFERHTINLYNALDQNGISGPFKDENNLRLVDL